MPYLSLEDLKDSTYIYIYICPVAAGQNNRLLPSPAKPPSGLYNAATGLQKEKQVCLKQQHVISVK